MRYLSVCSGIEAASVAWAPLGWKPLAFAEIDAFPRAVLQHHHPDVPLYGDFTQLRDMEWIVDADVLVGGTPCQSFSVAGKRGSLRDDRGNLSLEFVRLADAIDDLRRDAGKPPVWIVWETVPGVLSTSDNAFGTFLGGMVGGDAPFDPSRAGGWTRSGVVAGPERVAAWRVLDAQHFGVAQRRRRVFVLALGGAGAWACADALLPIRDSLSGHPAPRREAGKNAAPTLSARTQGGGRLGTDTELDGGLVAQCVIKGAAIGREPENGPQYGEWLTDGTCYTLNCTEQHAVAFTCKDYGADAGDSSPTLRAMGHDGSHANAGGQVAVAFTGDVTHALNTANNGKMSGEDGTGRGVPTVAVNGLELGNQGSGGNVGFHGPHKPFRTLDTNTPPGVQHGDAVRRLTPAECEALQGFPRGYTAVPYRNGIAADGPRYKALGNSMAVPVIRWIGQRIDAVRAIQNQTEAA